MPVSIIQQVYPLPLAQAAPPLGRRKNTDCRLVSLHKVLFYRLQYGLDTIYYSLGMYRFWSYCRLNPLLRSNSVRSRAFLASTSFLQKILISSTNLKWSYPIALKFRSTELKYNFPRKSDERSPVESLCPYFEPIGLSNC